MAQDHGSMQKVSQSEPPTSSCDGVGHWPRNRPISLARMRTRSLMAVLASADLSRQGAANSRRPVACVAGFHQTLAQVSMKGHKLPNPQKIGQQVDVTLNGR